LRKLVGRYSVDARCDPEYSGTSGLSAGSSDPWDRRSTVTRLVLLPGRQIAWSACRAETCLRSSASSEGRVGPILLFYVCDVRNSH